MSGWHEWRERWGRALLAWRGEPDEVSRTPARPDSGPDSDTAPDPDRDPDPDPDNALDGDAALRRYAIDSRERTQLLMELESARTDNEIRLTFARTLAVALRTLVLAGAVAGAWLIEGAWTALASVAGASLLAGLFLLAGRRIRRRQLSSSDDGAQQGT